METKVQKWGNSLGLRLNAQAANKLNVESGTEIELEVFEHEQYAIIRPKKRKPRLEDLLSGITNENKHTEIDTGNEGNELL